MTLGDKPPQPTASPPVPGQWCDCGTHCYSGPCLDTSGCGPLFHADLPASDKVNTGALDVPEATLAVVFSFPALLCSSSPVCIAGTPLSSTR